MLSLKAEVYRDAAREHVTVAVELYITSHFVLAHYITGLAVECILQGYQVRRDAEFDSKHDLRKLAATSRFAQVFPESRSSEYAAKLLVVYRRWSNDFRFQSSASLRARLLNLKLHEKVKGDFVKESARQIVIASTSLVALGVSKWK